MKQVFKQIVIAIITAEAKLLLKRARPTIIGITGNVGKTSTKDAIYTVLKQHVHTRKSQKSFNSDIGVPLSILGLQNGWDSPLLWLRNIVDGAISALFSRNYPEVLVLEMGVDRPGDMKRLCSWVKPDIAVLTRFPDVPSHVEYFGGPDEVAAEKMELVNGLKPDGVVIYNHDDERIRRSLQEVRQQAIGYSRYSQSQFTAGEDVIHYEQGRPVGLQFVVKHIDETVPVTVYGALGVPHVYISAAALAVAAQFAVPLTAAAEALGRNKQTPGRMRLLPGKNDITILDDTYNSSPAAAEQALTALKEITTDGRKIAVLGDMLELGQFSSRAHEHIGKLVPEAADMLVTVGMRSRKTAETALEFGMSEKVVWQYDDIDRAADEIARKLEPGDVVLVKASQGIRAERLVKTILKEPDQAPELLVRQSVMWDKR